jgi:gluconolactonase
VKRFCAAVLTISFIFLLTTAGRADDAKTEKGTEKTKQVKAGKITLTVPQSWEQKPQGNRMRLAEFEVPAAEADTELGEFVVFHFENGAGGVAANIQRWVDQFDKEGRKEKIVSGESPQGKYALVDLTGTYNKSIGPPIQKKSKRLEDWRVLNVMLQTDSGDYFLKLDGPQKTIAAVEKEFRASFGGKKETEKERKVE